MSKIAILTDSSCDIPQEMAEKYGIDIMSFHILLDDVDYVERVDCTWLKFISSKWHLANPTSKEPNMDSCL